MRLSAKAVKIGRCVGIVFDPEPYGDNPWAYAGKNKDRSFAEAEVQVRRRGAQFMTALQAGLPEVRVLTFFHQPLGFDISEIIAAGQKKMNEAAKVRKPTP